MASQTNLYTSNATNTQYAFTYTKEAGKKSPKVACKISPTVSAELHYFGGTWLEASYKLVAKFEDRKVKSNLDAEFDVSFAPYYKESHKVNKYMVKRFFEHVAQRSNINKSDAQAVGALWWLLDSLEVAEKSPKTKVLWQADMLSIICQNQPIAKGVAIYEKLKKGSHIDLSDGDTHRKLQRAVAKAILECNEVKINDQVAIFKLNELIKSIDANQKPEWGIPTTFGQDMGLKILRIWNNSVDKKSDLEALRNELLKKNPDLKS